MKALLMVVLIAAVMNVVVGCLKKRGTEGSTCVTSCGATGGGVPTTEYQMIGYQDNKVMCYKIYQANNIGQSDAEAQCQSKHPGAQAGHLASILDSDEQNTIVNLAKTQMSNTAQGYKNVWIGLARNGNSWRWLDGKSVGYTNWFQGWAGQPQPDNSGGNQNCVRALGGAGWDDYPCSGLVMDGYVCRYLAPSVFG